jgi:predicted HTH domain antitoxin
MIEINFPKPVEDELRRVFGARFDDTVREVLIAEAFRCAAISVGQAANLLDLTIDETYGFMKRRGVHQDGPTIEEIYRESDELLRRLGRGGDS